MNPRAFRGFLRFAQRSFMLFDKIRDRSQQENLAN